MSTIPLWAQFIVAAMGGGIFGAVAGVISSSIAAKQKFKELDITYRQKLNDNLLQNSRQFVDTLYIPLNKHLSRIEDTYRSFKVRLENYRSYKVMKANNKVTVEAEVFLFADEERANKTFLAAITDYHQWIDDIMKQGNDVYFIDEFDKMLHKSDERSTELMACIGRRYVAIILDQKYNKPSIIETLRIMQREKAFFHQSRRLKVHIKTIALGIIVLKD